MSPTLRLALRASAAALAAALVAAGALSPVASAELPRPKTIASTGLPISPDRPPPAPDLRVDGDQIVRTDGSPIQLGGVNRAGAEYACAQGWGIFDGPVDKASIKAIGSWHANAVRIPLNEHSWLGNNGVPDQYGGKAYRDAIAGFVRRIERRG